MRGLLPSLSIAPWRGGGHVAFESRVDWDVLLDLLGPPGLLHSGRSSVTHATFASTGIRAA